MGTASSNEAPNPEDENQFKGLTPEMAEVVLLKLVEEGKVERGILDSIILAVQGDFAARARATTAVEGEVEKPKRELSPEQTENLLGTLKVRFNSKEHAKLHRNIA